MALRYWDFATPLDEWLHFRVARLFPVALLGETPLLYLLDGLDELRGLCRDDEKQPEGAQHDPRARVLEQIGMLLSDSQLVVTCRHSDFTERENEDDRAINALNGAVVLSPLRDEQIK